MWIGRGEYDRASSEIERGGHPIISQGYPNFDGLLLRQKSEFRTFNDDIGAVPVDLPSSLARDSMGTSLDFVVMQLQGKEHQETDRAREAKPDASQPMLSKPSTNSYSEQNAAANQREPKIEELHPTTRHNYIWLTVSGILASLCSGLFIGFALGRITK
jgi:hypothetical protein